MTEDRKRTSEPASVGDTEEKSVASVVQDDLSPKSGNAKLQRLRRFAFVAFYIMFLAAIVLAALAALEYYAYVKVKTSTLGQAYKDRGMDQARRSSQTVAPQFGYEPTPGFAAVRNTRLGNSMEYINEESFKDFHDVPREKPADEYRVIVAGGSVVYGRGPVPPADAVCDYYEVTYRWTIPHIMEKLLNADPGIREKIGGKHVRVINAGVAGYVVQNDLMRYLAKLRLFHPDLVVSLDGANEVHTVARPLKDWNYFAEGPYYEVVQDVMDMGPRGLMNYLTLWLKRNTYFFTWLALKEGEGPGILMENRGFAAHPQDPTPEMIEYRKRNIQQVADVVAIYDKVLETDGVPHVLALQPMFRNCRKKRTPIEQKIESVTGMEKIGFYDARETYDLLVKAIEKRAQRGGFPVVDLTGLYDNVHEWVFTDWCHLTDGANYLMAKALVNEVKTRVFGLPLRPVDTIHNPADSYFTDYSKESTVSIDGKPSDPGQRILKGYPSKELFETRSDSAGVVLDFGSVKPISRMRIVWGDKSAVPEGWQVYVSEDGKAWKSWLDKDKTRTDPFDQWPGYEYYSPSESQARFVKYVEKNRNKTIRLRQLSLYR